MSLSIPDTPPYEYQQHQQHHDNTSKNYPSSIMNSPESDNETTTTTNNHQSAFQRVSMILSPPLLEEQDIDQNGLLWAVRQRVFLSKLSRPSMKLSNHQKRVRPLRIQIPKPQWSQPTDWYVATKQPTMSTQIPPIDEKKKRKTFHTSSGRPTRVKGPCQACQETSDGCMRKAFNWPFATSSIFNDKGKPFVYLCNKCGLRYNKSGGCVCRNCRWVLCKEEKRKAMLLIEQMRRKRPDGKVDPEDPIENFSCTPKYWNCSHPWKVGWILNSQHDLEEEDDDS